MGLERKHLLIGLAALGVVGAGIYVATRPSDESAIRAVLKRTAEAVAPHPNESNIIGTVARVSGVFKETLTERVEIQLPEIPNLPNARADLSKAAAQVGVHYGNATLGLECDKVEIADDKVTAHADCHATLKDESGNGPREDKRRVNFTLRKDDGWRITTINVAERGVQ